MRRRRAAAALVGATVLAFALYLALGTRGPGSASAAGVEPAVQTGAPPAVNVTFIGSSPKEAPGETWGVGEVGFESGHPVWAITRYDAASGSWTLEPGPLDPEGHALSGFAPVRSVLAGEMTPAGDGALLGTVTAPAEGGGSTHTQALLVRDPGGTFKEAPALPAGTLTPEEALFSTDRAPLVAALDEGGHAGALVVPVLKAAKGAEGAVLHWTGSEWVKEKIALPATSEGFRVLGIAASSSGAWLLAQLPGEAVALYSRRAGEEGAPAEWKPVALTPGASASEPQPLRVPLEEGKSTPLAVNGEGGPPTAAQQALTATGEGVWIDGRRSDDSVAASIYFKITDSASGRVMPASWCESTGCIHPVEGAPPPGNYRSFAWADPGQPYGQRVITGLGEGVSLRLEGEDLHRVLGLGGTNIGQDLGAAFSSPTEGWLGAARLPVHITEHPAPTRLTNYPLPFHKALTAVAAQPGLPAGAIGSQAVAVGDQGEVSRYVPGSGWLPESLIGAGGRVVAPRLRAVAWPTPGRIYAVGDEGEMWLWRGETGLWEPDAAKPLNFVSNLLSIAFSPSEPGRGFAVGQGGTLLRFGKSWTQDPLPPEAEGASFTSVAFAGNEAIAVFRQPHFQKGAEPAHYTTGVLVEDGSGWHLDAAATTALGATLPWAVAGLPDGGAAISAEKSAGTGLVIEREGPAAPWRQTPVPYPGVEAPGSLALFREGGALRVVGSGLEPKTLQIDTSEREPPAGFPPNLIQPYPLESGYMMRQTATGWSDEQPDRNEALDPEGEYKFYDTVYNPDPISAVLIDPSGAGGWAVGGAVDNESRGRLDTSDVSRYSPAGAAEGVTLPGYGAAPITVEGQSEGEATFAVGGNAACAAPCADRARAGVGPDQWLEAALKRAQAANVQEFIYTGARVTTGQGHGATSVPWGREFGRYATVLGSSGLLVDSAAAPTDRGPGDECAFQGAFEGFAAPFGRSTTLLGIRPTRSGEECGAPGAQPGYHAYSVKAPAGYYVRVLTLDTSSDSGAGQIAFVKSELAAAGGRSEPAIVVGNADLAAGVAAGNGSARALVEALNAGRASAYFYDAREENVHGTLPGGSVPSFGSGTLGYISDVTAEKQDFHGHSGFLLVQVGPFQPRVGRAAVTAHLVPVIGELALEAKDGVLLRRSQVALFDGLARRPRSGGRTSRGRITNETALYTPIPAECVGAACSQAVLPEYTFTSTHPGVGDFVRRNTAAAEARAVLLGAEEKPIKDAHSGLFCAFNPGTTEVIITSGGFRATLTVTVQAGSVRRPCGTVPAENVQGRQSVPPPAPAPAPSGSPPPAALPPLIPVPPLPAAVVPPVAKPAPLIPFLPPSATAGFLVPFVPLPVPTPARPTPPSGTSPVTSPVEAPEKEEEHEEATEQAGNKAVAYDQREHEPLALYVLGAVVLAAFAGAAIRRPRRESREIRVAPATLNTMRAQQRMGPRRRR